MSRHLELNGRVYWVLSQPEGSRWKATVVEPLDPDGVQVDPVGIEATAETRNAADEAAERKLRRLLNAAKPGAS